MVITSPKDSVANSGDGGRDSHAVHCSERLLRSVYFKPYKACIEEAGTQSVMAAYNSVNGKPSGVNSWLLMSALRDEWGFEGFVVSDYNLLATLLPEKHGMAESPLSVAILALSSGLDVDLPSVVEGKGYDLLDRDDVELQAVESG